MVKLEPSEKFTIVRQIGRHTDTNTYYIQAVIRNSRTDEVLDTVNLDDQGNQRFTKDWQVPADTSGQGFYIDITTSVYEDSNYNTKSPNYADSTETYLVQRRYNPNLGGGGGGYNFTPGEVRDIIQEEVQKALTGQDKVDITPISQKIDALMSAMESFNQFDEVRAELKDVKTDIQELPGPKDYSQKLDAIQREIDNLPEPEKNSELIKEMEQKITGELSDYQGEEQTQLKRLRESVREISDSLEEIEETLSIKKYRQRLKKLDQAVNNLKRVLPEEPSEKISKRANNLVR